MRSSWYDARARQRAIAALGPGRKHGSGTAQQATPADLVDALNGVFGKHPGDRAAHTKGICLTGTSRLRPTRRNCQRPAHFAKEVPITARFSLGGGNPQAPDNAQDNVRGLPSNSISATARAPISRPSRRRCFSCRRRSCSSSS